MKLYVDLDLLQLVAIPGYTSPRDTLVVRRGDQPTVQVYFVQDGAVVDPGSITLTLVVKSNAVFDEDPALVLVNTFVKSGTGTNTLFTGVADFDTADIATLVGDAESAAAMLEVGWTLGGYSDSAERLDITIQNAANRDGDSVGPGVAGSTGVDATITSEAGLAAVTTTNLTVPVIKVWVNAATVTLQVWLLKAGTDATEAGSVLRPTDYNASTNAKVWYRAA